MGCLKSVLRIACSNQKQTECRAVKYFKEIRSQKYYFWGWKRKAEARTSKKQGLFLQVPIITTMFY